MNTNPNAPAYNHLEGSALNFVHYAGTNFQTRYKSFDCWINNRRDHGVFPFGLSWKPKALQGHSNLINFGSHDYLGLSHHPAVLDAAREAVDLYGIHNASSQALTGRTELNDILEQRMSQILGTETCVLFPTGWMAGYGALSGLANGRDTIVLDKLAHNCLQCGAQAATENILKFRHNDMEHLEQLLSSCREKDHSNGLFVVTETHYSMNSDGPDMVELFRIIDRYNAILIIDVAHDLGANGARGLGSLEKIRLEGRENVVIMGAFSKTFASNGGFLAGPRMIRNQIMFSSPSYVFSSGISTFQCAVVLKALDIVFSDEGTALRKHLRSLERYANNLLRSMDFELDGIQSQIIPVVIGMEGEARLMSNQVLKNNLVCNLVEFPAVPKNRAILRLLLKATHSHDDIDRMAAILCQARETFKPIAQPSFELLAV